MPEELKIDYQAAIEHCYKTLRHAQGTGGCIAFAKDAEWMRDQVELNRRAQPEPAASADADYPCRSDGRCQYAIDHGAEGMGHCPRGKCAMADPAPSVAPEPLKGWKLNHVQFVRGSGKAEIGYLDPEDDRFSPIVTVDTGLYYEPDQAYPLSVAILEALQAAHPPRAPLTDGELWSWTRSVMSQAACIQQDYAEGKFSGHEQYSAHLDAAAATRADELEARISAHGIRGQG